ncbi:hypothetical protein E6O75_ATG08758 [Venturia nashicola]|uniref:Uncharacterized protein n=1 Tax=Venturia nashicola TaxID=86259 RepID=A0A4Z1P2Q0_9PEZI|nr:hypothetical protein E6O75_ATG08758 [Venturia nashicola]
MISVHGNISITVESAIVARQIHLPLHLIIIVVVVVLFPHLFVLIFFLVFLFFHLLITPLSLLHNSHHNPHHLQTPVPRLLMSGGERLRLKLMPAGENTSSGLDGAVRVMRSDDDRGGAAGTPQSLPAIRLTQFGPSFMFRAFAPSNNPFIRRQGLFESWLRHALGLFKNLIEHHYKPTKGVPKPPNNAPQTSVLTDPSSRLSPKVCKRRASNEVRPIPCRRIVATRKPAGCRARPARTPENLNPLVYKIGTQPADMGMVEQDHHYRTYKGGDFEHSVLTDANKWIGI